VVMLLVSLTDKHLNDLFEVLRLQPPLIASALGGLFRDLISSIVDFRDIEVRACNSAEVISEKKA